MKADYAIFMDFGLFSKILVEFFGSRKGVGYSYEGYTPLHQNQIFFQLHFSLSSSSSIPCIAIYLHYYIASFFPLHNFPSIEYTQKEVLNRCE